MPPTTIPYDLLIMASDYLVSFILNFVLEICYQYANCYKMKEAFYRLVVSGLNFAIGTASTIMVFSQYGG